MTELNHAELAIDEDRQYKIDKWARLFKATTWEELRRCAGDDAAMQSAVNIMKIGTKWVGVPRWRCSYFSVFLNKSSVVTLKKSARIMIS